MVVCVCVCVCVTSRGDRYILSPDGDRLLTDAVDVNVLEECIDSISQPSNKATARPVQSRVEKQEKSKRREKTNQSKKQEENKTKRKQKIN